MLAGGPHTGLQPGGRASPELVSAPIAVRLDHHHRCKRSDTPARQTGTLVARAEVSEEVPRRNVRERPACRALLSQVQAFVKRYRLYGPEISRMRKRGLGIGQRRHSASSTSSVTLRRESGYWGRELMRPDSSSDAAEAHHQGALNPTRPNASSLGFTLLKPTSRSLCAAPLAVFLPSLLLGSPV